MSQFEKIIFTELPNDAALNIVKDLSTEGIIQQREDYIYLKIDDDYIHHIQPVLAEYGNIAKPAYFYGSFPFTGALYLFNNRAL